MGAASRSEVRFQLIFVMKMYWEAGGDFKNFQFDQVFLKTFRKLGTPSKLSQSFQKLKT